MNTYCKDMLMKMGLPSDCALGLKITVCDLNGVLVEGHRGVIVYSPDNLILRIKEGRLIILGKSLAIMEITADELYIRGKIFSVAVENV